MNPQSVGFEPIAIVGQSCTLPGALDPQTLWANVLAGRSSLSRVPADRWGLPPDSVMGSVDASADRTWSDVGGYVSGFRFDATGTAVPADTLRALDPLFQLTLQGVRDALRSAGCEGPHPATGLVLGNLSFPSAAMARFAQSVWLGDMPRPHPLNRFNSGLPAHLTAHALGLGGGAFALDAACASSLYAIKLACDRLHDRSADRMVAGAVNQADDLFIHVGFCALSALSKTGQSRPFHRDADGLVPAEGAAFVVLERLADALAAGRPVLGVIRGVGLSNDGRGRGLLAPSEEGQERALRLAYAQAGLRPADIGLLECHATGTPVGDATELRSMARVFAGGADVPIGSLKSNLGHLITVAGAAGLIKVLAAMAHGQRPPTLHVDQPSEALAGTPFRLLQQAETWTGPRRAGISAFGFGGNNAHLIVEALEETPHALRSRARPPASVSPPAVAIVGIGARVGQGNSTADFARSVLGGAVDLGARATVEVALTGLRFPPTDLQQSLAQQTLVLEAAREAAQDIRLPRERTAVLVGMGCDAEVARYGTRWRLAQHSRDPGWLAPAREGIVPVLQSGGVVGTMPNIPANRINSQLDLAGPAFTVSAEEASGITALQLATRALQTGEIDAALVGAVDLSHEPVHLAALAELGLSTAPADAAVVLTLKRLDDARRDGDTVWATLGPPAAGPASLQLGDACAEASAVNLTGTLGKAHAAHGLLQVAAAALALRHGARPRAGAPATPWLGERVAEVAVQVLEAAPATVRLHAADGPTAAWLAEAPARLQVYSGADQAQALAALDAGVTSARGPARIVVVAADAAELDNRRAQARRWLESGGPVPDGVAFREAPITGQIAFVFAGAAAAYPGMGRELALALPKQVAAVGARCAELKAATDWIYGPGDGQPKHPLDQLWGSSFVCQLHAELTRQVLGLRPAATIGYSSGESNALFAMGAWNDLGEMMKASRSGTAFTRDLVAPFDAARRAWRRQGLANAADSTWASHVVAAPLDEVKAALALEPLAHLTIINTAQDCVIGGEAAACARVVQRLGANRSVPLGYDMAAHCPEVREIRDAWWQLHYRNTQAVPGVRFYTNATGKSFTPSPAAAADAITGQAIDTLDFTRTIEQAWADGVRVFIEHGPRGLCSGWIRRILGEREHLAVSLDMAGRSGVRQVLNACAWLVAAGVRVNVAALESALAAAAPAAPATGPQLSLPAHAPAPRVPVRPPRSETAPLPIPHGVQMMEPAPYLEPVLSAPRSHPLPSIAEPPMPATRVTAMPVMPAATLAPAQTASAPAAAPAAAAPVRTPVLGDTLSGFVARQTQVAAVHQDWLAQQAAVHARFLALQQTAQATLQQAYAAVARGAHPPVPMPAAARVAMPVPSPAPMPISAPAPAARAVLPVPTAASPRAASVPASPIAPIPPAPAAVAAPLASDPPRTHTAGTTAARATPPEPAELPGPKFDRAQLEILAGGKISSVFGPLFAGQDGYARQVRMPEPPLLLADRVTGIDAVPGSMGKGTLWTETDVRPDSWYLDGEGRMPAGVMIESGQADLLLISWLGVDALNRGERVYRLLGCDLTWHGGLPVPGDTLCYDIHVDGHATQGEVRLFFFHYDCRVRGQPRLTVRNGQAGFFTDAELANSAGVLWDPEQEVPAAAQVDAPAVRCSKSAFSPAELQAFAAGRPYACFGPGWEGTQPHVRSPRITAGNMRFLHEVTAFDPQGGPWGRGYLRAETPVSPDDWFFKGHFKNDPCMPGTLMFDGCLQAMSIYLAALGYTVDRDGWRFEPVPDIKYPMRCRGQVTPSSQQLVYEVFVSSVLAGPMPTVFADLLCTVDGRKAFHARGVGLRLVPDWPLEHWKHLGPAATQLSGDPVPLTALAGLVDYREPKPVAVVEGFAFDYHSLLACAWGPPSAAFGPFYARFDGTRRAARLPGPPYHFMSRVTGLDGPIGGMKAGSSVEVEYDVPVEQWYFEQNGHPTMPFCVVMEAALQPCGWLASYIGSALASETDLLFRNLDGTGTLLQEITPTSGIFRTKVKLLSVSQSAGMIIENFEVECWVGDQRVFEMKTVFGFFPREAFENQVGLPVSAAERAWLTSSSDDLIDLTGQPTKYCGGALRLPGPMLRMLDRVTGYWPQGGPKGLGALRAEKTVDADEWFFKAHFFQDPVQPGSLGVEALCQLLQFFMLEQDMGEGIANPRFEPLMLGTPVTWKYRGQVVPKNQIITSEIQITEIGEDAHGRYVIAEGFLWVDGKRIYSTRNLGMRIVAGTAPPPRQSPGTPEEVPPSDGPAGDAFDETLNPRVDTWLQDHCPTWTLPALPMMSMVDRLVSAARAATGMEVSGLREVQVHRWLPFANEAVRLRTEVSGSGTERLVTLLAWRESANAVLSRFEPVASGRVLLGSALTPVAALAPLDDAVDEADPYASGALFHGPAFQYLTALKVGPQGSSARLRAERGGVPRGALHQGLLDAATHGLPHDGLSRWSERIPDDLVGYPYRLKHIDFHGALPEAGELRVEARFAGFDGEDRFPMLDVQVIDHDHVLVDFRLVEVLLPRGPIGAAPREQRRRFLRDRLPVPGIALSEFDGTTTQLRAQALRESDWLPGTVSSLYAVPPEQRADLVAVVAQKEHVARRAFVHPATVAIDAGGARALMRPLRLHPLALTRHGDEVQVRDAAPPVQDLSAVRDYWGRHFKVGSWPVEDLYYGLVERFVGDVVLADPAAFAKVQGRSCLYLANHQVGIESLLFSLLVSALSHTPTVTLAKAEHRSSWLGTLIAHSFAYPGVSDPGVIHYVDRDDQESLLHSVGDLGTVMTSGGKSLMVHAEGTRSRSCGQAVTRLGSAFIDLALAIGAPIVPVRLVGGLPVTPVQERLDFPVDFGRQDYWIGRPVLPEELAGLPLKARKDVILAAMNALGPALADEVPFPGDLHFAAEVQGWREHSGASLQDAVLYATLAGLKNPGAEVAALLEGARSGQLTVGDDARAQWLGQLAQRLYGPRGPQVAGLR
ncbi:MAG: 1-acyl-sn-glycerol-3-phosphate acyltransferase [Xanthomonadales bacterium]|jgi:acyl transferase domain-containing protein/3-hydroxymyristoyl/3-hydroxydecanoyl-(acyl carrier protein) dehydratase/1-acyl-sn-glycerol-3-phosphate acyltransferase|nr:1-acyl-sn-glycerol-3-phosphate acyltransferase [Xanthomonadales bacterium]